MLGKVFLLFCTAFKMLLFFVCLGTIHISADVPEGGGCLAKVSADMQIVEKEGQKREKKDRKV